MAEQLLPKGPYPVKSIRDCDPLSPEIDKKTKTCHLYGYVWDMAWYASNSILPFLMIELFCFKEYARAKASPFPLLSPDCFYHFKRSVDMIWNGRLSNKRFDWQVYSEKMARFACEWDYLAIAGAASTGKSDFAAIWALTQIFAAPKDTLVLLTSTSLKGAKGRVWASLRKYLMALPPGSFPFKLIDSNGLLRFSGPGSTDQMGVTLIAADTSKSTEASSKLIGMKNKRVILIADELSELADSVLKAAFDNLSKNPYFQLIGLSNPKSRFDPMGILSEPAEGWDSINIDTLEWRTKYGYAIRLDGRESPNLVTGETVYPYLLTQAQWDGAIARAGSAGENAPGFLRMTRGWFPDAVAEECIYSQADFDYAKAWDKAVWGLEAPVLLAACDPAFTAGGDRVPIVFCKYGKDVNGLPVLERHETVLVSSDATNKDLPVTHQLCHKIKNECVKRGVFPRNFAMDTTGGGGPMADTLSVIWSKEFLRVSFSGKPSDRPISPVDPTPADESVANRVSELWLAGVDLLRAGQVKGIDTQLAKELSARYYDKNSGAKRRVEPKQEMKRRVGYSPDVADAWCVALELARCRLGMVSKSKGGTGGGGKSANAWKKVASKFSPQLTAPGLLRD